MKDCKVVIRPRPPVQYTFDPEELAQLSLQARVTLGELPPPPIPPTPVQEGGYNLENYYLRPEEGRGASLTKKFVTTDTNAILITDTTTNTGPLITGETFNINQREFRPLGRWYVSRISSGSRPGRFVRPKPIVINLAERREYVSALSGDKRVIVAISGSIMTDNGGPVRITSFPMRTRMASAPFTNPHYTDVAHDIIIVGRTGSATAVQEGAGLQIQAAGTPEEYLPRVTIGCSIPNIPVDTGGLRQVWLDQQTPLYAAGMSHADWIFYGPVGDEMVIDDVYDQIDWTLTPGEVARPTGAWVKKRYSWNGPRQLGDWYEYDANTATETITEFVNRGINYFPFLKPRTISNISYELAVTPPYSQSVTPGAATAVATKYDAYSTEVNWLNRTYQQPRYDRANLAGAALIPELLQQYLEGVTTIWNRINRDTNVIRFINNAGNGTGFELYYPHVVGFMASNPPAVTTTGGGPSYQRTLYTADGQEVKVPVYL